RTPPASAAHPDAPGPSERRHRARAIGRGPLAVLAAALVAPAVRGARGCHAAGVARLLYASGAYHGEAEPAEDSYRVRVRATRRVRGPVAELAGSVVAPAVGGSRGCNAAGVITSGAHRRETDPVCHRHTGPAARGHAVAQLA